LGGKEVSAPPYSFMGLALFEIVNFCTQKVDKLKTTKIQGVSQEKKYIINLSDKNTIKINPCFSAILI
jgi:hypothetical protein